MSKQKDSKVWIKIKRGLVVEPKHRQKVGSAIWLYLMLIDAADWETGIVDPYKDEDMAVEMAVSKAWIRKQRRVLEEYDYITTKQLGPKGMQIAIMRWVNPKAYDGAVKNTSKKSVTDVSLSKPKSVTESSTESDTKSDTDSQVPSIRSGIKDQAPVETGDGKRPNVFRLYESILGLMVSSDYERERLMEIEKTYPADWIEDAMEEAVGNNVRKLKYVESILTRWKAEGRKDKPKLSGGGGGAPAQPSAPYHKHVDVDSLPPLPPRPQKAAS